MMGMLRNPAGHREVTYDDEAETAGSVALASALVRHLDRVQARLVGAGRAMQAAASPSGTHLLALRKMKKTVRRLAIKLARLLIGVVGGGIAVQDTTAVGILSTGRA